MFLNIPREEAGTPLRILGITEKEREMQKEIGIKKLVDSVTSAHEVTKMTTGNWYLKYDLPTIDRYVQVEFTTKNFAENLLKLPYWLQTELIYRIVDSVENPGDVLVIIDDTEHKDKKIDARVIRLNSDHPKVINLLVTH